MASLGAAQPLAAWGPRIPSVPHRLHPQPPPLLLRWEAAAARKQRPGGGKARFAWACASAHPREAPLWPDRVRSDCGGPGVGKMYDVVALNNLCVDIVVPVDELPPPDVEARERLLQELASSNPSRDLWEVGGTTNFLISAARLGMKAASIGHANDDQYGEFLENVLKEEAVLAVEKVEPRGGGEAGENTLLCFVLVDPGGRHAFCSRYDFGPWPLLQHVQHLPEASMQLLRDTRAIYVNGFCFDELRPDTVMEAVMEAESHGAAIFFDPGPRCLTLLEGERRAAMDAVLNYTTGILVTLEEGAAITGRWKPLDMARSLMDRPGSKRLEWVVVKNGGEGATLVTRDSVHVSPGFQVEVEDTVGCGDSFAAAIVLGYIRSADIGVTLRLANAVGAATATRRGAGRNVGDPATVRRLLSSDDACSDALRLLEAEQGRRSGTSRAASAGA